jgi:hypothetical protein
VKEERRKMIRVFLFNQNVHMRLEDYVYRHKIILLTNTSIGETNINEIALKFPC